jgi:hypothetical protein
MSQGKVPSSRLTLTNGDVASARVVPTVWTVAVPAGAEPDLDGTSAHCTAPLVFTPQTRLPAVPIATTLPRTLLGAAASPPQHCGAAQRERRGGGAGPPAGRERARRAAALARRARMGHGQRGPGASARTACAPCVHTSGSPRGWITQVRLPPQVRPTAFVVILTGRRVIPKLPGIWRGVASVRAWGTPGQLHERLMAARYAARSGRARTQRLPRPARPAGHAPAPGARRPSTRRRRRGPTAARRRARRRPTAPARWARPARPRAPWRWWWCRRPESHTCCRPGRGRGGGERSARGRATRGLERGGPGGGRPRGLASGPKRPSGTHARAPGAARDAPRCSPVAPQSPRGAPST